MTHFPAGLPDHASAEATLDAISVRFTDLVAAECQQQLLETLSQDVCSATCEEEMVIGLFRALTRRCGAPPLFYLGIGDGGAYCRLQMASDTKVPTPSPMLSIAVLERHDHSFLARDVLMAAFGKNFPARYGLYLRHAGQPLAVVGFEAKPADPLFLPFLDRLATLASMGLMTMRQKESLSKLEQLLARQQLQLRRQNRMLQVLDPGSRIALRLESWQQQLEELLGETVVALDGEKGSIMVLDDFSHELVVRYTCGLERQVQERIRSGEHACKRFQLGEGLAGSVAQSLQPKIANSVDREPLFVEPISSQVQSIMCLPLEMDGLTLGVMNITNQSPGRKFLNRHMEEGMKLASQAAALLYQARLDQVAILDPVSGTYSKSHFNLRTRDEVARARRYQRPLCFLVIQLAGLGALRTQLGDQRADGIERDFAQLLQQTVRETDLVGRWADHTYAVLMPETSALEGMFAAERICQVSWTCAALEVHQVTAHVGLSSYPEQSTGMAGLVSQAEQAARTAVRSQDLLPVLVSPGTCR
ncbi:diguanylate cyclase [bacterium]|nr:diguanylate cyclase [bacterium]